MRGGSRRRAQAREVVEVLMGPARRDTSLVLSAPLSAALRTAAAPAPGGSAGPHSLMNSEHSGVSWTALSSGIERYVEIGAQPLLPISDVGQLFLTRESIPTNLRSLTSAEMSFARKGTSK